MFFYFVKLRKILFYLLSIILFLTVSGCATTRCYHDNFFGKDKLYHFTASGVIGAGVTAVSRNNGISDYKAPVIGVSVSIGIGAGKEFYDLTVKETYWSWKDIVWNLIGSSVGSYAVSECK